MWGGGSDFFFFFAVDRFLLTNPVFFQKEVALKNTHRFRLGSGSQSSSKGVR